MTPIKYPEFTEEVMKEIHQLRLDNLAFKAIRRELNARHGWSHRWQTYYDYYVRWQIKNGFKTRLTIHEMQQSPFAIKVACMKHLLDLVREHGPITTNRHTREVVEGGYPNLNIPELESPAITHVYWNGSGVGSSSAYCVGG